MPPRKKTAATEPVPPGPLWLDMRVGPSGGMPSKTVLSQAIYSYHVDQQGTDRVVITAEMRPTPVEEKPEEPEATDE